MFLHCDNILFAMDLYQKFKTLKGVAQPTLLKSPNLVERFQQIIDVFSRRIQVTRDPQQESAAAIHDGGFDFEAFP